METPLGNAASGIAGALNEKWFTVMGLVGLLLYATTLVMEIPADVTMTRCIALMMFGWGFGQAECRTFRKHVGHGFVLTKPAWRLTVTGAIMFVVSIGATIRLAFHLLA